MRLTGSVTLAAAMGLLSLAACHKSPEAMTVDNKADMLARDLEARADNMSAIADTMANDSAAAAMSNAASAIDDEADQVRDAADAKIANMQ
ncbi:MAG: hypothetical protein OSB00_09470 [Sphingomonas bacterium]|nr:hypothetical protein [Sphingomonas bacterium]